MSSIVIERQLRIKASPETVFGLLIDLDALQKLHVSDLKMIHDGQALTVGSSWKEVSKFMGRNIENTLTVLEMERPHRYKTGGDSAFSEGTTVWQLTENEDGHTVADVRMEGNIKGFFGGFAGRMAQSNFEKIMEQFLANIVKEAERRA